MADLVMVQRGLYAIHDTGAPAGKDDYITLVMIHGFTWHASTFRRLLPFAQKYNARIILVNRRDYPEASPFTEEELKQLSSSLPVTAKGTLALQEFIRDRSKDLYDFLETLIKTDAIPQKSGIALGAWSVGAQFTTTFLAHAASFPVGDINVASYIRYVVNLDMPAHFLGYPLLKGCWNPLFDPTLPPGEGMKIFPRWVTGYFMHGETIADVAPRDFNPDIPPTLDTMSQDDITSSLHLPPGLPGGSDDMFSQAVVANGICPDIRKAALYLPTEGSVSEWYGIKLRHVWCDRSTWSEFWGAECLQEECNEAKKLGRQIRPVEIVRLRGANHFAVWDQPERTLRVLLGGNPDEQ